MSSTLRSSLDIDQEFLHFVLNMRKKTQDNIFNNSTPAPGNIINKTKPNLPVNTACCTPKTSPTITQTTHSPRTPIINNTHHQLLSNYRLNNMICARASSPKDLTKLTVNESILISVTPSPRTPRGVMIHEPLPSYRLRRLRHHLDAHRRPNFT